MYNYYLKEKKLKQEKEKEEKQLKELNYKMKRKKEIDSLVVGYETRLRNFVYNMASEPITITDYNNNVGSTRKAYFDEHSDKILGKKGMVMKGFKTEKQRLEEYLQTRNDAFLANEGLLEYNNYSPKSELVWDNSRKALPTDNLNSDTTIIKQPSMRFKPRTDLERIADATNAYNFGRVDMKIIQKQLKELGLNVSTRHNIHDEDEQRSFDSDYNNYMPYLTVTSAIEKQKNAEIERQKKIREKILKERQEMKNRLKRKYETSEAKQLMSDLHNKTHFKGATGFTLFHSSTGVNSKNKTFYQELPRMNTKYSMDRDRESGNQSTGRLNTFASLNKSHDSGKNGSRAPPKNILSPDIRSEIANMNPLLFNLNTNPFKITKDEEQLDDEKFRQLKELAFKKETPKDSRYGSPLHKGFMSNFKKKIAEAQSHLLLRRDTFFGLFNEGESQVKKPDEDKIKIDNEVYQRSDLDKIAKKVLTKCNFFHSKNKNNSNCLKSREGKLMQTNGLTVTEFTRKYKLQNN
jgi:hypothetical protein